MKEVKETRAKAGAPEARGLCETCDARDACMYLAGGGVPVIECEEFVVVGRVRLCAAPPGQCDAGVTDADVVPGLCKTCDHVATCMLPRPPGGVWQCEEFA